MTPRLSKPALQKILAGQVKQQTTCIVKFYSNSCPYCRELQPTFSDISEQNTDASFFAFNVDDYPRIEDILNFNGVPTIAMIKVGTNKPKIRIMSDPKIPDKKTWYTAKDIQTFINKENT